MVTNVVRHRRAENDAIMDRKRSKIIRHALPPTRANRARWSVNVVHTVSKYLFLKQSSDILRVGTGGRFGKKIAGVVTAMYY